MARAFTDDQKALLRSANLRARLLTTWYLDDGTYRFCDDVEDMTDGTDTFIGASALAAVSDIVSSRGFSAEPITLTIDGTRMNQVGFTDPAELFRGILALNLHQRRVDFELGLSYPDEKDITMRIPIYAGKINNAKVTYQKVTFDATLAQQQSPGTLEIAIDSLAARYQRVTSRTRSHQDQQRIDPTDLFFSFVVDMVQDRNLFWGKKSPLNFNPYTGQVGTTGRGFQ